MEIDSIYQKRKAMGMKEVTQGVDTENGEKKGKDPEKELTTQEEDRQERAGPRLLSEAGVLRRGRKSIVSSLLRGQDILEGEHSWLQSQELSPASRYCYFDGSIM